MTLEDLHKYMWKFNHDVFKDDYDIDEEPLRRFGMDYNTVFNIYDEASDRHRGEDWTTIKIKLTER